ncbi:MAG: hypothetical protein HFP76_00710 [Methylococcales symbiont of Iophon sp. n. MRB-2018]|nr:MAG: hypothetical protein HFP76_00710 [Methylococcales symbiont of Iophon sp. n. MRB-2018]
MDKTLVAYDKLYSSIPPIGFINRKKRIAAFLKISNMLQIMVDKDEVSENDGLYLLSVLARKCSRFQKAAMMTALNLTTIDRSLVSDIGFKYSNDFRCSLRMYPVDDKKDSTLES